MAPIKLSTRKVSIEDAAQKNSAFAEAERFSFSHMEGHMSFIPCEQQHCLFSPHNDMMGEYRFTRRYRQMVMGLYSLLPVDCGWHIICDLVNNKRVNDVFKDAYAEWIIRYDPDFFPNALKAKRYYYQLESGDIDPTTIPTTDWERLGRTVYLLVEPITEAARDIDGLDSQVFCQRTGSMNMFNVSSHVLLILWQYTAYQKAFNESQSRSTDGTKNDKVAPDAPCEAEAKPEQDSANDSPQEDAIQQAPSTIGNQWEKAGMLRPERQLSTMSNLSMEVGASVSEYPDTDVDESQGKPLNQDSVIVAAVDHLNEKEVSGSLDQPQVSKDTKSEADIKGQETAKEGASDHPAEPVVSHETDLIQLTPVKEAASHKSIWGNGKLQSEGAAAELEGDDGYEEEHQSIDKRAKAGYKNTDAKTSEDETAEEKAAEDIPTGDEAAENQTTENTTEENTTEENTTENEAAETKTVKAGDKTAGDEAIKNDTVEDTIVESKSAPEETDGDKIAQDGTAEEEAAKIEQQFRDHLARMKTPKNGGGQCTEW
ncbi:hypothetical protein F4778DRAFT_776429 [Xylariomycetidae sp. FL2044]|nr:hypothetical protein F4778DRAFT_776429 [Xylariomycetidae sp. FL2044]